MTAFFLMPAGLGYLHVPVAMSLGRAIGGAVGGTTLGLIQWFFLRRDCRRAGLWVLANALGYGTAIPISWNLWWKLGLHEWMEYAAMGAVVAAITGLALVLILPPKRQLTARTYSATFSVMQGGLNRPST